MIGDEYKGPDGITGSEMKARLKEGKIRHKKAWEMIVDEANTEMQKHIKEWSEKLQDVYKEDKTPTEPKRCKKHIWMNTHDGIECRHCDAYIDAELVTKAEGQIEELEDFLRTNCSCEDYQNCNNCRNSV